MSYDLEGFRSVENDMSWKTFTDSEKDPIYSILT